MRSYDNLMLAVSQLTYNEQEALEIAFDLQRVHQEPSNTSLQLRRHNLSEVEFEELKKRAIAKLRKDLCK